MPTPLGYKGNLVSPIPNSTPYAPREINNVSDVFRGITSGAIDIVKSVAGPIYGEVRPVVEPIVDRLGSTADKALGLIDNTIGGIGSLENSLIGAGSNLLNVLANPWIIVLVIVGGIVIVKILK